MHSLKQLRTKLEFDIMFVVIFHNIMLIDDKML